MRPETEEKDIRSLPMGNSGMEIKSEFCEKLPPLLDPILNPINPIYRYQYPYSQILCIFYSIL